MPCWAMRKAQWDSCSSLASGTYEKIISYRLPPVMTPRRVWHTKGPSADALVPTGSQENS